MKIFNRKKRTFSVIEAKNSFFDAMNYIKILIRGEQTKEDKILLMNYVLSVIKRDLQAEFQAAMIYEFGRLREIDTPFPNYYYDENGILHSIIEKDNYKEIDLSTDCVFALPWRKDSVVSTLKMLTEIDFEFIKGSHASFYYYPVDICYVYNGIHSISAGMHLKKGTIKATICDISPLFSHIYTDGANWYNIHTNEAKDSLYDFRTGLLFEVAKIKYGLENNK